MNSNGSVATNIAILHPNIFYYVSNNSWSVDNNKFDFWNKDNTEITNNNNTVKKTIYSPSPTGYAEPKPAAFTGFTSSGGNQSSFNVSGGFDKGWNFYCQPQATGGTFFLSALGIRYGDNGVLTNCIVSGIYWTAGPSGTPNYARSLNFNPGVVYPQNEIYRSFGFSVLAASE